MNGKSVSAKWNEWPTIEKDPIWFIKITISVARDKLKTFSFFISAMNWRTMYHMSDERMIDNYFDRNFGSIPFFIRMFVLFKVLFRFASACLLMLRDGEWCQRISSKQLTWLILSKMFVANGQNQYVFMRSFIWWSDSFIIAFILLSLFFLQIHFTFMVLIKIQPKECICVGLLFECYTSRCLINRDGNDDFAIQYFICVTCLPIFRSIVFECLAFAIEPKETVIEDMECL